MKQRMLAWSRKMWQSMSPLARRRLVAVLVVYIGAFLMLLPPFSSIGGYLFLFLIGTVSFVGTLVEVILAMVPDEEEVEELSDGDLMLLPFDDGSSTCTFGSASGKPWPKVVYGYMTYRIVGAEEEEWGRIPTDREWCHERDLHS